MMRSMRISHEAIYQALYVEGRGALKARARRLPAHGPGIAGAACSHPSTDLGPRHARGDDQRTPSRGRRPRGARALGRRSPHRARAIRDRHARRAHHPLHDASSICLARRATASFPQRRTAPPSAAMAPWPMKNALASDDHHAARSTPPIADVGPWQGAVPARSLHGRDRRRRVLRRSTKSLATRDQREHQRALAPILPEGNRPLAVECRGDRGGRQRTQQPTAQDPRLEDSSRGAQRAPTVGVNKLVLRRPIEPGQFTSWAFTENVRRARVDRLDGDHGRLLRQCPDGVVLGVDADRTPQPAKVDDCR